jgi:hypothetical protein
MLRVFYAGIVLFAAVIQNNNKRIAFCLEKSV